jgi:repressor LexA
MSESVRPTKKQRELLNFIEAFIAQHEYSPSYREIMNGLQYNSVATVALHVGNLIKRGHLRKRDHSARSLEVVRVDKTSATSQEESQDIDEKHEQWLLQKIHERLNSQAEEEVSPAGADTLLGALRLLGLHESADKLSLQLQKAE